MRALILLAYTAVVVVALVLFYLSAVVIFSLAVTGLIGLLLLGAGVFTGYLLLVSAMRLKFTHLLLAAAAIAAFFVCRHMALSHRDALHVQTQARGERIIGALTVYRGATGNYPEALDRLVPAQIAAIPEACFKNSAFHYTKSKKDDSFSLWYDAPGGKSCRSGQRQQWICAD